LSHTRNAKGYDDERKDRGQAPSSVHGKRPQVDDDMLRREKLNAPSRDGALNQHPSTHPIMAEPPGISSLILLAIVNDGSWESVVPNIALEPSSQHAPAVKAGSPGSFVGDLNGGEAEHLLIR
jgi:hypothetical protein